MDAALEQLILERLAADEDLDDATADLVLAGCDGAEALEATVGGVRPSRSRDAAQLELPPAPPGAFLDRVEVQGFRGVGEATTLQLSPGPGLTIVAGRNGSGKSSFAEGLELLMTGASSRWETRKTKVWVQGWQNLHFDGPTVLKAALVLDGQAGRTTLAREWPHGVPLSPGECELVAPDGSHPSLDDLGWTAALSRYRPFLSFNELGQMFDELKTMYDALSAILGLDDIEALAECLRSGRLTRDRLVKELRKQVKLLRDGLAGVDDDRARAVLQALAPATPDLDAIELTLDGVDAVATADLADLRAIGALAVPPREEVDAALDALNAASTEAEATAHTDAGRAASLAQLLEDALAHDERHADGDCPVCATKGVIDEHWRLQTTRAIMRLQTEASAAQGATRKLAEARRTVGDLLPPQPPRLLDRARELGLDPGPAERGWERWRDERDRLDDPASVARLRDGIDALRDAVAALAEAASAELERREDAWRPLAVNLTRWLPQAREAVAAEQALPGLRAAERWATEAVEELRTQRLAPIADAARANWDELRQASNVSLEGFHLRKRGTVRAAEVDVRVDGSDASAFGVMSQGELHALAVSVFLPRAALPESPFRFMVIDDPVQSMDPAKVDGLARVLQLAARTRQVVVFSHDERLPEACRRLRVEATVLEVTRRPGSHVEVRAAQTPVERHIADARALLRDENVPREVAERVVPGFCRHAVEASCSLVVRRRRLGRGARHQDVEEAIEAATTLYRRLALALHDDPARTGDVLKALANRYGQDAATTVKALNRGVHADAGVDLEDLAFHAARLARKLAEAT